MMWGARLEMHARSTYVIMPSRITMPTTRWRTRVAGGSIGWGDDGAGISGGVDGEWGGGPHDWQAAVVRNAGATLRRDRLRASSRGIKPLPHPRPPGRQIWRRFTGPDADTAARCRSTNTRNSRRTRTACGT